MVHTILVYMWVVLSTLIMGPTATIVALVKKNGDTSHLVARLWGKLILLMSGVRVIVRGGQHIGQHASYIYMSNHQSNFDIPVILGYLPVQFRILAKAELFTIPVFGRGMQSCGYIQIDRSNRRAAIRSLRLAAETIRGGVSVVIFPEGTRSGDGKLQSFKKGGFVMAIEAGIPIVPVVIHGTHQIMPKGHTTINPRPVTMDLLPPIDTSDYSLKTKDALMRKVHQVMSDAMKA